VAGVGGQPYLPGGLDLVDQPVGVDVLPVELDAGRAVQRGPQPLRVADRGDAKRRRVDDAVQQQRVADAAHRGQPDDPLVHDRHGVRPARPQRVHHGLHVLLVDDQVVRAGRGDAGGERGVSTVARRVVEHDGDGGTADCRQAGGSEQGVAALACVGDPGVAAGLGPALTVDRVPKPAGRSGEGGHPPLLGGDQFRQVVAPTAQVGALRGRRARREQQARQGGNHGHHNPESGQGRPTHQGHAHPQGIMPTVAP